MLKFVDALRVVTVFYAAAGYPLMILAACGQHKRSGPTWTPCSFRKVSHFDTAILGVQFPTHQEAHPQQREAEAISWLTCPWWCQGYIIIIIIIITITSSTAQGGGGSFKNRKPIGEIGCCESGMAERSHWWTERWSRSPLFLSLPLTIYLPTYLCMYLSIGLSLSLFHLITYRSIYLSNYLSIYLSTCLSVVQCHSVV